MAGVVDFSECRSFRILRSKFWHSGRRTSQNSHTDTTSFPVIQWGSQDQLLTPVAGPIFETKIESFFLESFFLERNYCSRSLFSGSNACSILSNQVNSFSHFYHEPHQPQRIDKGGYPSREHPHGQNHSYSHSPDSG